MICRVCLQASDKQINIYNANTNENIAEILQQHLWFKPLPNDSISTVICHSCWDKVFDFHNFYVTVEQAHLQLVEANSIETTRSYEQQMVKFKVKEELEDIEQAPDNPLYEPEVMQSLVEEHQEYIKTDIYCSENNTKDKLELISRKLKSPVPTYSNSPTTDQIGENTNALTIEPNIDVILRPKRKKRQMITEYDDEIIKKHIPMGCDLCTFVGENFSEMTKHFSKQHIPLRPYVKCCGRKLTKRFLLIQHAYKHEDPEFFKCSECQKVFSDGYILRAHVQSHHAPEKDLTFKCDQCPKSFSRRHLLELHKPAHIPVNERKFFCEKCPQAKPFASEHLLSIHIHMRHTKATNVCHVCAKEIRDNQAFKKHVRLHFEDSGPRVKCPKPDCDRWLKDEDNLKQHLRRHNDEGKIFACDECGKKCKNRRSLTSHLRYAHTDQVFTCDECNKTFKKAITLKEHMAQHTGETLYKCPFCTRTFNSNANMHSHKKKMHPIEWDIWRKTKRCGSQQIISKQSNLDTLSKIGTSTNSFALDFLSSANSKQ